jgi:S1-C subfamily serine protease
MCKRSRKSRLLKTISLIAISTFFNLLGLTRGFGQAERTQEVVGDCLAIVFLDPQQPSNRPMSELAQQAIEVGWTVRIVDARRELHTAERWRVHTAPTTVLVRDGREVDRILGPVSWFDFSRRMLKFSSADSIKPAQIAPVASASNTLSIDVDSLVPMQKRPASAPKDPQAATVRILVDEPESFAVGSGTIIESSDQGSVVLTCGHLFRNWSRNSTITVERFEQGVPVRYPAELIDYQIDDIDLGVLLIQPGKLVPTAAIANHAEPVREGDIVFSVGCDHGQAPTRRDSRVTKLNRYLGAANIETAGIPVQGRSGGGLFNNHGELIGVCFAADKELDEGLYCGTQVIHDRLNKIGFRKGSGKAHAATPQAIASTEVAKQATPATMTVILTDSSGSTRQLTIDRPTEQLLNSMQQEAQRTRQDNATSQVRWKVQVKSDHR